MTAPTTDNRLLPQRKRDLLVLGDSLVIAADSVGGIGPKPGDTVYADATTVAHFALRVPLLEVLCASATPVAVVNTLCVELEPTGATMIAEIRRLAAEAGIPAEAVTGSTEDNVATIATGIGVTVLGCPDAGPHRIGGSQPGDIVVCAGLPVSAPQHELYVGHPAQVPIPAVRAALATGLVHDALPVGSKGVGWEVSQLAETACLFPNWDEASPVSLTDSGGPASCVLFSCAPDALGRIGDALADAVPQHVVATLIRA